jgi:hypothetical protein
MFNFDRTDLQRFAVAAVAAIIFSTTAVTAAVGPGHAVGASQTQLAVEARA